ncbi:threonine deaminase [Pseudogymnoascus destructans]|uniref:ubiquitinyl hydrolase 1 n=1 Tax=Pseudogymnoascus destructans TaxID=655981 RepID=A0A177AHW2_9PEZI|nr:threonine deaminase [Pseudogymnoascus destructans]OAF61676.1 threonine deaminase [Pseudogymnoascus destructans]
METPNGVGGSPTIPCTPSVQALSLTEYAANPSPPREGRQEGKEKVTSVVPLDFMLPTGYPDVLLKREDLQPVFSFKLRIAYNKMAHLDPQTRWKGVVACSAGNHAQGGTPSIKHLNVTRLGGSVVLHGADFDAAKEECYRLEKLHGLTNISPLDDPYVIAGQGTIGMELLNQTNLQQLEAIFCCVGGGGLIAGIGAYVKRIAPHSLAKGERVLKEVGLFADGAAVKQVGEETFRICQEVVDEVIQVTTDETCAAIRDVFEDTRSVVEPAGALSIAGLKKYVAANPSPNTRRQLVAIASGANMNFDRLRFVAERAALGEGKEALLRFLENNPEVMNQLAYKLGLSEELAFYDVYSLTDPDLLAT